MPRGALETRQLRMEFGHAGSVHAQMRGTADDAVDGNYRQQGAAGEDATVPPPSLMPMHRLLMSSNPSLRDGRPESARL